MRLMKESEGNNLRLLKLKSRNKRGANGKKVNGKNSFDREVRPRNVPAPIDEIEFFFKSIIS